MIQIIAIVFGVVVLVTNYLTWSFTADHFKDRAKAEMAEVMGLELQKQAQMRDAMAELEAKSHEVQVVEKERVRTITKEVQRVVKADPIYIAAECVLPPDGVRVYNAAASGMRLASATVQAPVVPAIPAPPVGKSDSGGSAGGGGVVLRPIPRVQAVP